VSLSNPVTQIYCLNPTNAAAKSQIRRGKPISPIDAKNEIIFQEQIQSKSKINIKIQSKNSQNPSFIYFIFIAKN